MSLRIFIFFASIIGCYIQSSAQADGATSHGVATAVIEDIEQTGKKIFVLDTAARVATDALGEIRGFRKDPRLKGWITEESAEGVLVSFVGSKGEANVAILYRALVSMHGQLKGMPESLKVPQSLTDEQMSQFRARQLGLSSVEKPCSKSYNSVVLPRSSPDSNWVVYALPGTKKTDVVPVGGSYRIETDSTGAFVVSSRGFAKSCIELVVRPDAVALSLTHLLDPSPTEIHVFLNLLSGSRFFIITVNNRALWGIAKGRVAFIKTL